MAHKAAKRINESFLRSLEKKVLLYLALLNAQKGNLNNGFAFAGSNVFRVNKIVPVKKLIETIIKEYEEEVFS